MRSNRDFFKNRKKSSTANQKINRSGRTPSVDPFDFLRPSEEATEEDPIEEMDEVDIPDMEEFHDMEELDDMEEFDDMDEDDMEEFDDMEEEEDSSEPDEEYKASYFRRKERHDEDSESKANRYKIEHNELYLEFVIDGTSSFREIFVPVYRAISKAVGKIKTVVSKVENSKVKYGLTIMGDQPKGKRHSDGSWYTESSEVFLKSLTKIQFTGGSLDGYENLNGSIESALRKLENHSSENSNRAIIVFTDSMPKDVDEDAVFLEVSDCPNRGIRFALVYLAGGEYFGFFNLVDGKGNRVTNGKNTSAEIRDIAELLQGDSTKQVSKLVSDLVNKTSVTS